MDWLLYYLLLGSCVGIFAGLFGIGGGTLLVPALLLIFESQHFNPQHLIHLALGTSMATILFTSIASMYKHHQHHAVNWSVVRNITPGILLGTALGAFLATNLSTTIISLFFACFVYFSAALILFDKRPKATRRLPGIVGYTITGIFTGGLSSLVSIGGGTIMVPFLIWCNVSLKQAIGTSSAIGFPIALGGTLGYILAGLPISALPPNCLGFVYWPALLGVAFASVLTAPLGAMATHRLNVKRLRKLFSLLLILLATKIVSTLFR